MKNPASSATKDCSAAWLLDRLALFSVAAG
jgi:hypothetical protein